MSDRKEKAERLVDTAITSVPFGIRPDRVIELVALGLEVEELRKVMPWAVPDVR